MFGGTYYVVGTGFQGEQTGVVPTLSQLTARGGGRNHRQDSPVGWAAMGTQESGGQSSSVSGQPWALLGLFHR